MQDTRLVPSNSPIRTGVVHVIRAVVGRGAVEAIDTTGPRAALAPEAASPKPAASTVATAAVSIPRRTRQFWHSRTARQSSKPVGR